MLLQIAAHTLALQKKLSADDTARRLAAIKLTCPTCSKVCVNTQGLASHLKAKRHFPAEAPDLDEPIRRIRQGYTIDEKCCALERYYNLVRTQGVDAHTQTCKELWPGIWMKRKGYLTRWIAEGDTIRLMVALGRKEGRRCRVGAGSHVGGRFAAEEDELYMRFYTRRVEDGYPVNHYWLQSCFKTILAESKPPGHEKFKFSVGWAVRFCVRYGLTTQSANNVKAHDQVDRQDLIRKFHQYWLMVLQPSPPQTNLKYGRFGPECILHVDQVPLPFASSRKRTIHMKNFGSCRISGPNTGGLEKRQATLQLWICADAIRQYVLPTIIFRGSRGPKSQLPWAAEKELYETLTNIRVAYQPNAWADEVFCEQDIINVAADMQRAGIGDREVCVGMDNHSAQRTPNMLSLYKSLGMVPLFTAPNCTDCISPVDHHIGRQIQNYMAKCYQEEVDANPAIWIATSEEQEIEDANCKSAMNRRMLMAKWLSRAWTDLVENHSNMIDSAFVHTGFLIAKGGSEDHLIELQGWTSSEAYRFRTQDGVAITL